MVLFEGLGQSADHLDGNRFRGLFDFDNLKAPSEGRISFEVLLVLSPCGGRDSPQFTTGQCGLEQVGRISLASRASGTNQRMRLVNKKDDWLGRRFDFFNH